MKISHRTTIIASLVLALFGFVGFNSLSGAAPMPPRIVVNHQEKQCAQVVPGDECGDIVLPSGWEYLDPGSGEQCPDGYAFVEINPNWIHFKAPFCCTAGHSGSSGDCEDLVINQPERQCAFVADIQSCTGLPPGWQSSPDNCPAEFTWVEDVVCTSVESGPAGTPASAEEEPGSTDLDQPTISPAPGEIPAPTEKSSPSLPCASFGMALVGLLWLRTW